MWYVYANLLSYIYDICIYTYICKLHCSFIEFLQLDPCFCSVEQLTAQEVSRIGAVIVLLGPKGVFLFRWGEGCLKMKIFHKMHPPKKKGEWVSFFEKITTNVGESSNNVKCLRFVVVLLHLGIRKRTPPKKKTLITALICIRINGSLDHHYMSCLFGFFWSFFLGSFDDLMPWWIPDSLRDRFGWSAFLKLGTDWKMDIFLNQKKPGQFTKKNTPQKKESKSINLLTCFGDLSTNKKKGRRFCHFLKSIVISFGNDFGHLFCFTKWPPRSSYVAYLFFQLLTHERTLGDEVAIIRLFRCWRFFFLVAGLGSGGPS